MRATAVFLISVTRRHIVNSVLLARGKDLEDLKKPGSGRQDCDSLDLQRQAETSIPLGARIDMKFETLTHPTFTMVIVVLSVIVFVLDLLTPLGVVIWTLYIIPLGLASWYSMRSLLPITAGVCSVLVILGYFYSPPGLSYEYVAINRTLGIVMLWSVTFLLWAKRNQGAL